ncbi:MAG: M67 family metallopeptidase [Gemmatimonadota bacterium]|nr:M67 family metallopeptidase [Gemmatimonadota bacterium]
MTLRLPGPLAEEIRRHGEAAYPAECCGALVGRIEGEAKAVVRLAPAVNRRTDDPHRYLIAPDDLRRLEGETRAAGQEIVGFYHSHPDHPARPSPFDTEHAWPWYSYLIVRIERGRSAELASWLLDDARPLMHPESLDVFSEV